MTNQEAIKLIEHLKEEIVDLSDNEIQALDIAIKVLEKSGADNVMYAPKLYQGCLSCDAHNHCFDAFCSNAVNCNAYGKGGAEE